MRHLIVAAHPRAKSFNHAVTEAFRAVLVERGHEVAVRDLYAAGFNPVLSARELANIGRHKPPRDVRTEQAAIRRADVLTFIAPIWWSGFPAMLQGYLDRVFSEGFAYIIKRGSYVPGLADKKAAIVNTSGASAQELRSAGTMRALKVIWDEGLIEFCGMEMLGHLYLGGIVPDLSREEGERRLAAVRRFARETF